MIVLLWSLLLLIGVAVIVWGAETFALHLGAASVQLGVSTFALGVLLAGAEPEELVTVVTASLRGSPGIALGDVIGANVAICLVALGVGAVIAPLPFRSRVLRYALAGLPVAGIACWFTWDGMVDRPEGIVLIGLYVLYVAVIWFFEGRPPALGEVEEIEEAEAELAIADRTPTPKRVGRELLLVLLAVAAMAGGASLLVEAVQRISGVEETQTDLGLTLVGFATAFELVVLAWSASRRGASETVVAGVVGSFAYNSTMTLGAGALVQPLVIEDTARLHLPLLAMLTSLALVIALAVPKKQLGRLAGLILLAAYPLFVLAVLFQ
ncbi:sodium:calcium antiporter [Gloeobacter kilaueensis]|uniref:CaCA family Na(+)/Ca(+) antiporter n=1 Tax=Gloeobacter kilaueensis (strain ATCC BAA-2537 / CCAP 1431/1 / ULC 316 / JS1) TaxID=1183438 RepID=U5QG58_GLOK1|nr:CaCA family Na(+)/Ca(+) antiporter [Gloeobacter kilaueensis]AGY57947.1 CaCA family Na(+)/Ca(+) antiporter [Gloeobacter kilaueensis JS1]